MEKVQKRKKKEGHDGEKKAGDRKKIERQDGGRKKITKEEEGK
jgi:hypothetical protein